MAEILARPDYATDVLWSGRLWSLLDMLKLHATPFLKAHAALAAMWSVHEGIIHQGGGRAVISFKPPHDKNGLINAAMTLEEAAIALDAKVTAAAARRLIKALKSKDGLSIDYYAGLLGQTVHLAEELEGRKFLCLSLNEADLYEPKAPLFGQKVHDQFPGPTRYEIDQAGKCLAIGLDTAAAFHVIRCLEAGIHALSRYLRIPDPTKASDRNWGKLLKAVKDGIDSKWPTSTARMSGDGEFFDNAYASLAAMQNPWRNATMHLDQKYSPEEAVHVFHVVRGFMQRMAIRMDESGEPFV